MRNYAEQSEAKKFWKYVKRNMLFTGINTVKNIFHVSKTFPVLQQNSLCFPCQEKVRTKFPVFPVPWPPCFYFMPLPDFWLICIFLSKLREYVLLKVSKKLDDTFKRRKLFSHEDRSPWAMVAPNTEHRQKPQSSGRSLDASPSGKKEYNLKCFVTRQILLCY